MNQDVCLRTVSVGVIRASAHLCNKYVTSFRQPHQPLIDMRDCVHVSSDREALQVDVRFTSRLNLYCCNDNTFIQPPHLIYLDQIPKLHHNRKSGWRNKRVKFLGYILSSIQGLPFNNCCCLSEECAQCFGAVFPFCSQPSKLVRLHFYLSLRQAKCVYSRAESHRSRQESSRELQPVRGAQSTFALIVRAGGKADRDKSSRAYAAEQQSSSGCDESVPLMIFIHGPHLPQPSVAVSFGGLQ